jgi:hypothetical protein
MQVDLFSSIPSSPQDFSIIALGLNHFFEQRPAVAVT